MPPHNLTYTLLGTGLLWFGWFGFNAGSAVAAGALSTSAFVATNTAAAAAAPRVDVPGLDGQGQADRARRGQRRGRRARRDHPGLGLCRPVVVNLHRRSPAACVCFTAVSLRTRTGVDDSLDVFGVHGIGGTFGALLTGLFAQKLVNPSGADGLLFGNPSLLGTQVLAVAATWAYSIGVTFVLLKILDATMGLRVEPGEEDEGLDVSQHGESAYELE